MGLLDKVYGGVKNMMLKQFRESIPKGIKSGKIVWQDDLDKMAGNILNLTGKRKDIESIGITIEDIKGILVELKGKHGQVIAS